MHKVKDLREAKGLTQEQLAAASGLTVKTVWRAEAGYNITMRTLERLAKALQVDIREVLTDA